MVGCLYISEFPAWALQAQHPEQRAIAVYHEGRIVARSRFLTQSGMLLGDPLDRARALFPAASFFDRDTSFERASWQGVLHQINETTPFLESLEPGVAFFKPFDSSTAQSLVERLAVRIGGGPYKSFARIAAVRSASGSFLQVRRNTASLFLSRTSVALLSELGFDDEIAERLALFGLTSLDRVATLTQQHLRAQFGTAGASLFDFLHPGPAATRVAAFVPAPSITETFRFEFEAIDLLLMSSLLDWMVRRAVLRLGHFSCSRVALELRGSRDADKPSLMQRVLKQPTSDFGIIRRAVDFLLRLAPRPPQSLSSITLTLTDLENPRRAQGTLFFERPSLRAAIERLDERFPGTFRRAVLLQQNAPFPEESVRLVPFLE